MKQTPITPETPEQICQKHCLVDPYGAADPVVLEAVKEYAERRVKEETDHLVSLAVQANNHARRLLNSHDPNNIRERMYIDRRARDLAAKYADNSGFKIVQS